jgi:POT family proton-dependent oligopeptide transporter
VKGTEIGGPVQWVWVFGMMTASPTTTTETLRYPRGLATLFFTEMWERCSYYGMRALLILFMTAGVQQGGLGFSDKLAGAIYGLYTATVYMAALPGGWVSDRLLGAQKTVWIGGTVIALGHFTLAVPRVEGFFLGLLLVALGTGLLKPNISAIVGKLYPEGGARRDAGFTIFYMGINLGSFIGPLVCGWLGEKINWHLGFAAAGVGMVAGLVQFSAMRGRLGDVGRRPEVSTVAARDWWVLGLALAMLAVVVLLIWTGVLRINAVLVAQSAKWIILGLATVFFVRLFLSHDLDAGEKRRVGVIAVLFVSSALFFSGFEQAGSSLNLFAERHTARMIGGWETPTTWFQMVNPLFVILLAPLMAGVWVWLARRERDPSLVVKFALGLLILAAGFVVIMLGAQLATRGRVVPVWLLTTYFLHTVAELCVSPVGLSSVTKLAPPRYVGQMMGVWFLATSLGNLIAGLIAGEGGGGPADMAAIFSQVALAAAGLGVVLLAAARPMRGWMVGIK